MYLLKKLQSEKRSGEMVKGWNAPLNNLCEFHKKMGKGHGRIRICRDNEKSKVYKIEVQVRSTIIYFSSFNAPTVDEACNVAEILAITEMTELQVLYSNMIDELKCKDYITELQS